MNYFNQTSKRLIYRRLTKADIPAWLPFFENNAMLPYVGIDLSQDAKTLATGWILKQLKRYEAEGLGHLAIIEKESGAFIGMTGLLVREIKGQRELEVSYSLKPAFWGKGYGTEAAITMKEFGMKNALAKRFLSIIHKDNLASMHIARKNGMEVLFEMEEYLGMEVLVFGIEMT